MIADPRQWPVDFRLEDDFTAAAAIRSFTDRHLAALADFDAERQQWVSAHMPHDYKITYFFHAHALRVAEDMRKTALFMGLPAHTAANLHAAMLPHDIGKTLLPVHIWDTVEKPDAQLKALRRSHTELGVGIVKKELGGIRHPQVALMADIMLNHHEQMDGNGYLGKMGAEISAPARLACIVESFDGYSTARPHFGDRDISVSGVLARMRREKGAAFYDMALFDSFAAMKMAGVKPA